MKRAASLNELLVSSALSSGEAGSRRRSRLAWAGVATGLLSITGVSPSWAQSAPPGAAAAQTQPAEDDPDVTAVDEVVITGSRIRRSEFNSASPIQVITSEQSTLEGLADITEILQGSSIASGSTQINNLFTGFVVAGGSSVNTVSLRGLGAQRTLVLLNGRRLNPAGTRGQVGAVDLNVLPQSIVERVEILKDGASSVYGSDAVAGVVNVITKPNTDGGEIGVTINQPFESGGEEYQVQGSWGRSFERGGVRFGFEFFEQSALQGGDRDYLACRQDLVTDPVTGERLDLVQPSSYGLYKCRGALEGVYDTLVGGTRRYVADATAVAGGNGGCDLSGYRRVGATIRDTASGPRCDAATSNPINVQATRDQATAVTENDPRELETDVISPVTRYTLTFAGDLDLSSDVELYGEFLYNRRESTQDSARQLFPNVAATNPYNPFGQTARSIILVDSDARQEVDYGRAVAGLRGQFSLGPLRDWAWDVYLQYGRSDGDYTNDIIYNDRVLATTQGGSACVQSLITISGGTCPTGGVNYFRQSTVENGTFTDEEAAFLFGEETGNTIYEQTIVEAVVSGDLFQLPAGTVGGSFGVQWREESIDDTPGANAQAGNLWGQTSAGRTAGTDRIAEVFGELAVPLLSGLPLVESLELQLSGRFSDYDSYGESETYKLGLNWRLTPEFRVRATRGTSFRAPALYELFLANQTSFLGQANVDPCINWGSSSDPQLRANCAADGLPENWSNTNSSALIVTGGGVGILEPETSEANTVGVIWTPGFADFNIAVDYFDIIVENQVSQFGAGNIVSQCYNSADFPNDPFCTLFDRETDPNATNFGQITTVNNSYVNLDTQTNRGIDATVRYGREVGQGRLTLDAQVTWSLEDRIIYFGGDEDDLNGEVGEPDVTGNASLRYDQGPWTVTWSSDFVSQASDATEFGGEVFAYRNNPNEGLYKYHTEALTYHTLSVRYRADDWAVSTGVQNLFDEEPPTYSTGGYSRIGRTSNAALASQYDLIGRRAFVTITRQF